MEKVIRFNRDEQRAIVRWRYFIISNIESGDIQATVL